MMRASQILLCLVATGLISGPLSAQSCQSFAGIDHCAVGGATLGLSAEGLVVQTASGVGDDGVRSAFAPTTLWEADVIFPDDEVEHTVLSSISGGEVTSRLIFEPDGEGQRIRATFTGSSAVPTTSLLVYDGGVLQAAVGGLDASDGAPNALRHGPSKAIGNIFGPKKRRPRRPVRFSIAAPGGCNWGVSFGETVDLQMPDGSIVQGDEVVFAEEVDGPGHYPYLGFEAIEIATSVSTFTILGDFV
ncbi:MAG: hypothetical protein AAGE94_25320, partial [Acidobacteriota bacterium]